jgi:hypothetical protein
LEDAEVSSPPIELPAPTVASVAVAGVVAAVSDPALS